MIVRRWLAPNIPSKEQVEQVFKRENLDYFEEVFRSDQKIAEHRHPFDEVRIVVSGELLYNVAGNKLLLRPGDRITIPSNTRHSKQAQGETPCISICAYRAY